MRKVLEEARGVLEEASEIAGRQWRKVGNGWRSSGRGKRVWIVIGLALVAVIVLCALLLLLFVLALRACIPKGSRMSLYVPRAPRDFYVPRIRRRR